MWMYGINNNKKVFPIYTYWLNLTRYFVLSKLCHEHFIGKMNVFHTYILIILQLMKHWLDWAVSISFLSNTKWIGMQRDHEIKYSPSPLIFEVNILQNDKEWMGDELNGYYIPHVLTMGIITILDIYIWFWNVKLIKTGQMAFLRCFSRKRVNQNGYCNCSLSCLLYHK